jgi:hypothetical protein
MGCVEGTPVSYNPRDMKSEASEQCGRHWNVTWIRLGVLDLAMHRPFFCSFNAGKSI